MICFQGGMLWGFAQSSWLLPAYMLEFKGNNTFLFIWLEGLAFFCANVGILAKMIRRYREQSSEIEEQCNLRKMDWHGRHRNLHSPVLVNHWSSVVLISTLVINCAVPTSILQTLNRYFRRMRFVSLLNFSKHPSYCRSYSYFSKANLDNVNQDINKIAQGIC